MEALPTRFARLVSSLSPNLLTAWLTVTSGALLAAGNTDGVYLVVSIVFLALVGGITNAWLFRPHNKLEETPVWSLIAYLLSCECAYHWNFVDGRGEPARLSTRAVEPHSAPTSCASWSRPIDDRSNRVGAN